MFKNLLVFDCCLFVARKAVPNWESSFPCCYPASIFLSVIVYWRSVTLVSLTSTLIQPQTTRKEKSKASDSLLRSRYFSRQAGEERCVTTQITAA